MSEAERYARHLEAEIENLRRSLADERKLTEEAARILDRVFRESNGTEIEARDWLRTASREGR